MSIDAPIAILVGGRATRLGGIAADRPKALVEVAGRPFIFHQLELLKAFGARYVVLLVGHLGAEIEGAVGNGSAFGLTVAYSHDPRESAGTGAALEHALPILGDEFLVLYGDTYLRIDYADVLRRFRAAGTLGLLTVLDNDGDWGPSNCIVEGPGVLAYNKAAPSAGMNWIDYGLAALRAAAFNGLCAQDLSEVYTRLAAKGELAAYRATDRFYEIGTPEALEETDRFLRSRDAWDSDSLPGRL